MMLIDLRSWLNEVALCFQILCKSILCPLWNTLYSRILCSPVVIVLACIPVFNFQLHNSFGKWRAFIAALTLDIIRRKCGVSAGVSLEQSFLFYVIFFFSANFIANFTVLMILLYRYLLHASPYSSLISHFVNWLFQRLLHIFRPFPTYTSWEDSMTPQNRF